MRADSKKQFELFGRYVRDARLEDRAFYSAVCYLRSRYFRVIKISGHQSRVNNRLLSNKQLMFFAKEFGWTYET